uniref:Uncharacterized protein n=1 Tax=Panagrolaimus sp. ES5 TaxID=591445 RepID=A0AC34G861_9BILA
SHENYDSRAENGPNGPNVKNFYDVQVGQLDELHTISAKLDNSEKVQRESKYDSKYYGIIQKIAIDSEKVQISLLGKNDELQIIYFVGFPNEIDEIKKVIEDRIEDFKAANESNVSAEDDIEQPVADKDCVEVDDSPASSSRDGNVSLNQHRDNKAFEVDLLLNKMDLNHIDLATEAMPSENLKAETRSGAADAVSNREKAEDMIESIISAEDDGEKPSADKDSVKVGSSPVSSSRDGNDSASLNQHRGEKLFSEADSLQFEAVKVGTTATPSDISAVASEKPPASPTSHTYSNSSDARDVSTEKGESQKDEKNKPFCSKVQLTSAQINALKSSTEKTGRMKNYFERAEIKKILEDFGLAVLPRNAGHWMDVISTGIYEVSRRKKFNIHIVFTILGDADNNYKIVVSSTSPPVNNIILEKIVKELE